MVKQISFQVTPPPLIRNTNLYTFVFVVVLLSLYQYNEDNFCF